MLPTQVPNSGSEVSKQASSCGFRRSQNVVGVFLRNSDSNVKFSKQRANVSRLENQVRNKDPAAEGFDVQSNDPTLRQSSQTRSLKFPIFPTK